jgi:hypothetical protein
MIPRRLEIILQGLRTETWVQSLLQEGELFLVGGTIRDAYRDEDIKDIDMIVEGPNMAQIKDILRPFGRVDEVGEHFAVIKFRPKGHKGEDFDIAVPRVDTKVGDGHKGFEVKTEGILLEDDLLRRDFTINSMAIDIKDGQLIDPFYGMGDLRRGIIRATDPMAFAEDPLRILRGIQFASRFGYEIDQDTMDLMKKYSHEIKDISGERIFDELMKVVKKNGDTQIAMNLIHESDVDLALFDKKMIFYEEGLGHLDTISFFWTLGVLGGVDPADFIKTKLRGDNRLEKNVRTLDHVFTAMPNLSEEGDILFTLSKAFSKAPDIMEAVILPNEISEIVLKMRLCQIPLNLQDVAINGDDIIQMSPKIKGEEIGLILEKTLRDALMNRFNWKDREASLKYLEEIIFGKK